MYHRLPTDRALLYALGRHDADTAEHCRRVATWAVRIAARMGWPLGLLGELRRGALLHDVGKIAVPDLVLNKPGKLSPDEWWLVKQHPLRGVQLASRLVSSPIILDVIGAHHELWDGSGYPLGLRGAQIPLAARIVAVADVYDALMANRPYKRSWTHDEALSYVAQGGGRLFDPGVVSLFLSVATATPPTN